MAQHFTPLGNTSEPIVLSATAVIPGETITFRTKPTGIVLEYPVPASTWPDNGGTEIIETIAGGVEQMVSEGLARGGEYVNTFDQNGLLVDYIDFIVGLPASDPRSELMTTTARVPLSLFAGAADPFAFGLIGDAVAILEKAASDLAKLAAA